MNEFTNVKVIQNPIKSHLESVTVLKGSGSHFFSFDPTHMNFNDGLWQMKVDNVCIHNYQSKVTLPYEGVLNIRTNLISTLEPNPLNIATFFTLNPTLGVYAQFVSNNLVIYSCNVRLSSRTAGHNFLKTILMFGTQLKESLPMLFKYWYIYESTCQSCQIICLLHLK